MTGSISDPTLRRLEWRCRRGMKELDLLLLRHLRSRGPDMSQHDLAAFDQFLELPDPELARYLVGGAIPADPQLAELCRRILSA